MTYLETLKASGVPEAQARAHALALDEALRDTVATKADIAALEAKLREMELRIVGRESVTVPAGTFNAFRIEGRGVFSIESGGVEVTTLIKWVAPDRLRREVAMEETRERSSGKTRIGGRGRRSQASATKTRTTLSQRWELLSFTQK